MRLSTSLPGSPQHSSPPRTPSRTNTLIVTQLPQELFQAVALDALKRHFAAFGEINQWAPIGAFGRVIIVYEDEDAAEVAKLESDPVVLEHTPDRPRITLRVFRADPNPLISIDSRAMPPQSAYLRPPAIEKNFLISPPGSPPVGWEPVKEDPPNSAHLAADLIEALLKLQMHSRRREDGLEVLLEPEEGAAGVGVYVEDCGGVWGEEERGVGMLWRETEEEDWEYGTPSPRIRFKPIATALPPLPTAIM